MWLVLFSVTSLNLLQGPLNRCSALNAAVMPEYEDKCLDICT